MMRITLFYGLIGFLLTTCSPGSKELNTPEEPSTALAEERVPPTLKNTRSEPDLSNMVLLKGGSIQIGSESGLPHEQPVFETQVEDYYLDAHPVTVAQFREFIQSSGYTTEAESFGDAGVFDFEQGVWLMVKGANWEYPRGKEAPKAEDDHPVTQVTWRDAQAYCTWAAKRLPTEVEWEYAARGGKNTGEQYAWGDSLISSSGTFQANVWQGSFPKVFENEDEFQYTSPVGHFGKNALGISDLGGNVWEWCQDTYRLYPNNPQTFQVDERVKAQRGGSFLCDKKVCHGFRVSGRSSCTWETALIHTGFRCAADVPK